jgi:hypothetical protein
MGPSPAIPEQPLPMAEGETVLAVLDPEVVKPSVNAEEAVALARASMGNRVGESPRVQLVRLAFRDPGSEFAPVWTGWITLSTDVPAHFTGGPYAADPASPPSYAAIYTWVYFTPDGEVPGATQIGYATLESVPTLPEEPSGS